MTPVSKEKPGLYVMAALRPAETPVPFPSAETDIDPQNMPDRCACGNWIVDCSPVCVCEGDK